ncbi:tautomerase family protein [uncultured Roseibium sp.]|uniref:tautomerase family protein n=1 Tax=uncultured Roseibium sp. TaxID=1936171 RepID=UPI003217035B
MPLVRVSMRKGRTDHQKNVILDEIYLAMRETFDVPEDDRFMILSEHDEADFRFGRSYLDIERSDDLVIIQLTVNNTRTLEQKRALYAEITRRLGSEANLRPQDVFINLVETARENWSLGNGIAQYA